MIKTNRKEQIIRLRIGNHKKNSAVFSGRNIQKSRKYSVKSILKCADSGEWRQLLFELDIEEDFIQETVMQWYECTLQKDISNTIFLWIVNLLHKQYFGTNFENSQFCWLPQWVTCTDYSMEHSVQSWIMSYKYFKIC